MIAAYERHNEEVRQAIAAEGLLVYRPGEPYPRANDREQFATTHAETTRRAHR